MPGHGAPTGHGAALPAGGLCAPGVAALAAACEENLRGFDLAYRATFWASLAAFALGALLPGWPGTWSGRHGLRGTVGADGPEPALSQP